MNYYSNGEFTIKEVERVNGYPLKKTGPNQYQGPCGYCRKEGRDTKGIIYISILQRDSSVGLVLIMSTEND